MEISRELITETERLSGLPVYVPANVGIHIHYSFHGTAEDLGDFDEFKDRMSTADIYIPEEMGWTDSSNTIDNLIASGDSIILTRYNEFCKESDSPHAGFELLIHRALYNSKVAVTRIDIDSDDPLMPDVEKLIDSQRDFASYLFPDEEISAILETSDNHLIAQQYREQLMLASLGPAIDWEITNNQYLKSKNKIQVLMQLGSVHTRIYHELQRRAPDPTRISRSFAHGMPLFVEENQLLRAGLMGLEMNPEQRRRLAFRIAMADIVTGLDRKFDVWPHFSRYERTAARLAISAHFANEEITATLEEISSTDRQAQLIKVFELMREYKPGGSRPVFPLHKRGG